MESSDSLEAKKEEVLKELHGSGSESSDDEKPVNRNKESIMSDIYAGMSDGEDEEEDESDKKIEEEVKKIQEESD